MLKIIIVLFSILLVIGELKPINASVDDGKICISYKQNSKLRIYKELTDEQVAKLDKFYEQIK